MTSIVDHQVSSLREAIRLVIEDQMTITTAANVAGVQCRELISALPKTHRKGSTNKIKPTQVLTISISEKRFKKGAMSLKNQMRKKGHHVKQSVLLDAAAIFLGFRNWQTMKATGFEPMVMADEDHYSVDTEVVDSKGCNHETS